MSGILIDTDWIIDVLNDQPGAMETLIDLAPEGLAISLITYGELYEGAYHARDPEAALHGLNAFLLGTGIVPLTTAIMERFAILRGMLPRQIRQQVGDMDLLIAATALDHDLTLVTRNVRDFRHVPNLRLFDNGAPQSGRVSR